MNSELRLLAETADSVFRTWADRPDSWSALEESGLTRIGVPEDLGGSGGDSDQAATVVRLAAYHSVSAPVAETLLLAGPLLAAARLPLPDGPLTAAPADRKDIRLRPATGGTGWELDGTLHRVPWAREARRIVVAVDDQVCLVDPTACTILPGANLAGEPRDDVRLDHVRIDGDDVVTLPSPVDLRLRAALARSIGIGGAAQRALEHSVRYAGEREQFGRPIGKFQAMQQYLAEIAGEVAITQLGVRSAARALDTGVGAAEVVAAARVNACRAASIVAELTHQIHGAIGTTQEHPLRLSTLRMLSWREEYGNEHHWGGILGGKVSAAEDPWALLTEMRKRETVGA